MLLFCNKKFLTGGVYKYLWKFRTEKIFW